jgi:hypothetical protein
MIGGTWCTYDMVLYVMYLKHHFEMMAFCFFTFLIHHRDTLSV